MTSSIRTLVAEPRKHTILLRNHENFSKVSYFFVIYITLFGILGTEWVVKNVSGLTF